jgi:Undecaprenyl-phosphate glucose phosphotransferase
MDNIMSRLGPSLRPAVLRSPNASAAASVLDAGGPPVSAATMIAAALGLDVAICLAAPQAATLLLPAAPASELVMRITAMVLALTVPFAVAAGAYAHGVLFHRRRQVIATLRGAGGATCVAALAVAMFADISAVPLGWAAASLALLLGGLTAGRLGIAKIMAGHPARRFAPRTVIIGSGLGGTRLLHLVRQLQGQPLRLLGVVDDRTHSDDDLIGGVPFLGPVAQVFALAHRGIVDQVVLALPWSEEERILDMIDRLSDYPVHVRLAPDLISYHFPRRARLDPQGHPVLHVADRPISGWASVLKRAEDLVIGCVALAICAIPMAVIALLIRLDSPGPVLFRQRRTGFNNHDFEMLKFRTMHHHLAEYAIRRQTTRNDPRVTRVGALLRRTSLDELPQLLNVLRGEMSIVGPRPHAPGTRAGSRPFEQVVERYAARHRVKPGLTGLAQVRGYRGETKTEDILVKRVESDLEYIDSWSVWLDLEIVLRTAVIVIRMKNAY